jgi:hypothetical protein
MKGGAVELAQFQFHPRRTGGGFHPLLGGLRIPPRSALRYLPPGLHQFRCQRVACRQLGSPLGRRQRTKSTAVAVPAPVCQGRRVQAFPAQDRSDPTNVGRAVGLRQNTQLRRSRRGFCGDDILLASMVASSKDPKAYAISEDDFRCWSLTASCCEIRRHQSPPHSAHPTRG